MTGPHKPPAVRLAVTLATLAAFGVTILAIRWVVATQRAPGAITVIEAQGMDMTAMKAPPGVQPVTVEVPSVRVVGGWTKFPATVMAFSDEEIVARVPGKVISLAYPGDHVEAGQVVAKMDAAEYIAQRRQAESMAVSANESADASMRQTEVLKATLSRTKTDLAVANVAVTKAQADKQEAAQAQQRYEAEADSRRAQANARQADLTYAEQNLGRQESLYKQGFISLDQFQSAERQRDAAKANLKASQAEALAKDRESQAAAAKVTAMDRAVEQAAAQAKSAQSTVMEASRQVEKARADARASAAQARATRRQSESSAAIAGYTELRSLDHCMVAERFVSPGAIVAAGQKLLMLHNADKVRVQAQLPEALAPSVSVGTQVVVHYGAVDQAARITSVFPTADTSTRTFTAEALLDNPGHRFLPGSFATLSVETQSSLKRLSVRSVAIQTDASGNAFVWVVSESAQGGKTDWTCPMHTQISEPGPGKCPICKMELVPRTRGGKTVASRRGVKVGASDGEFAAITSGLTTTDRVISAGFEGLIEGSPVKPSPQEPKKAAQ